MKHSQFAAVAAVVIRCGSDAAFAEPTRSASMTTPTHMIVIHAQVPPDTGVVYLAGSLPSLGPWDPGKFAMEGTGTLRSATVAAPDGSDLKFKFTLGSWQREAVDDQGRVPGNHVVHVDGDKEVSFVVPGFRPDEGHLLDTWKDAGILGRMDTIRNMKSAHLEATRHVHIWLPPGYDDNPDKRYRVLYMHDGQNLFDPRIANTGVDWGVDECVSRLAEQGVIEPPIVVGVWCTNDRRREYSPWDLGPAYARFLIEELMPLVNERYRTLTGPENTGTMGSSMGGLISFYLVWKHPDAFGLAGCLSTHWPWSGSVDGSSTTPLILKDIEGNTPVPKATYYFDYGTTGGDEEYEPLQLRVNEWLTSQGLVSKRIDEPNDFISRRFEGAVHNEAAWRSRLENPMKWLFGKPDQPGSPTWVYGPITGTVSASPRPISQ